MKISELVAELEQKAYDRELQCINQINELAELKAIIKGFCKVLGEDNPVSAMVELQSLVVNCNREKDERIKALRGACRGLMQSLYEVMKRHNPDGDCERCCSVAKMEIERASQALAGGGE